MRTPIPPEQQSSTKSHRVWPIAWALLALVFLVWTLKGKTPDTEWTPFSDQSSHLMATMSLWHDFDLQYTQTDLERFNAQFPAADGPRGTFLKQSVEGEIYFAKPVLYAALNAPLYGAFGTTGFVLFNLMAIAIMAALTQRIAQRVYGTALSHMMTAALFFTGPFMAWTMVIHPDLLIALLLFVGGYLALTQTRPQGWCAAGILLGMALSEKPTFAVAIPFLLLALPNHSLKKHGWIIAGVLTGWLIPTAINLSQDGNLLAYQGIRFVVADRPFPLDAGWTSPGIQGTGHIFDIGRFLHALTGNLPLIPSKVFDFFFGRQTGLLLYFPVALVFLVTVISRRHTSALLICVGLFAYLLLNALAFPSNGFGGMGSYGSRYLMQALPLLMLALLPLVQITPLAKLRAPNPLLGVSAVLASLIFQHATLPPSGKLVQDPTAFLLETPAVLFPLEDSLLPWMPINAKDFKTNNETATFTLFSRDAPPERIKKYVNGKIENQLTLYQHDAAQPLPALTVHSSAHAKLSVKNGAGWTWMGSISPDQAQVVTLDASLFQHKAFDLLDQKTKRWGALSIEMQSIDGQEKPAYASFDLNAQIDSTPIALDSEVTVREFEAHGIVPRFHWSNAEEWGRWTDGEYAELLIPVPQQLPNSARIQLTAQGFVTPNHPRQTVEIFLNGEKQYDHIFANRSLVRLHIPLERQATGKAVVIGFRMRNPESPLNLGLSRDARILGLGLHSLRFSI